MPRSYSPAALRPWPRHWSLASAITAALLASPALVQAGAAEQTRSGTPVTFDPSFFGAATGDLDLSRFDRDESVLPGTYRVDIVVNDTLVAREDITFAEVSHEEVAQLCLSRAFLETLGIDLGKVETHLEQDLSASAQTLPEHAQACTDIGTFIPGATAAFDAGAQRLDVSIPQRYMSRSVRGWVDPSQWDHGINAAVLGYRFNHFSSVANGQRNDTSYLSLDAGLNLGAWRLRHSGAFNWGSGRGMAYASSRSYAQRDLTTLRAQLVIGQATTTGDLFDAVGFRGASLVSDERMLPESQRGYAPVVRGTALTNALVSVHQRGYEIYQTTVAPGAFEIDDLYASGYGGDLEVTITEADGRIQRFTVPYAAVPQLLRPGTTRLSLTAGQLDTAGALSDQPYFLEATWRRGLTNDLTVYAGSVLGNHYGAALAGTAINTPIGAFSADITGAVAQVGSSRDARATMSGQSARVTYSKLLPNTGTNFALAAYRYSTSGYLNLADAMRVRADLANGEGRDRVGRQRNRLDLNINQQLGDRNGAVWMTGNTTTFWNRGTNQTTFSLGYSNTFKAATYSVSAQRLRESFRVASSTGTALRNRQQTQFSLTVSIPLGHDGRSRSLIANVDTTGTSGTSSRLGMSGSAGENRQWNYSVSARQQRNGNSAGANAGYRGPWGSMNAGYSHSSSGGQYNLGASGALVLHDEGLTVAQQLGETMALIQASGAKGTSIDSNRTLRVDGRGHAVLPFLQPYQLNTVHLDARNAPLEIAFETTSLRTAPRAGAVVKLIYSTEGEGTRAALIRATQGDGSPIPFGADVFDEQGQSVGVVGQASRLWLRGIGTSGALIVKWGEGQDKQCRIDYALPDDASNAGTTTLQGQCVAMQAASTPLAPLALLRSP